MRKLGASSLVSLVVEGARKGSAAWVVIDCGSDRDEALAELRRVRVAGTKCPVVVLLRPHQFALAPALLAAGADGCVLEGAPGDAVLQRATLPGTVGLSQGEQDVLHLLAEGYSYAAAASALAIGVDTVEGRVESLYRKLGVAARPGGG